MIGRGGAVVMGVGALLGIAAVALDWPVTARAAIVAGTCLALWLGELVPVWVPTLILWIGAPAIMAGQGPEFGPAQVVGWSADRVLLLFLGGFAMAAAVTRHGIDRAIARTSLSLARGRTMRLVGLAAATTAFLSMWMSNIAAAALMLGAMRPIWSARGADARLRGAMLLAVALAADLGGIATPIGSGPNGIAMAAVSEHRRITFLDWMLFGLPLAAGLTLAAVGLVWLRFRPAAQLGLDPSPPPAEAREAGTGGRAARVLLAVVCGVTVLLWLTEAAHGIASAAVAAGTVVALFATGLLRPRNALDLDWSTMLLIAGGIGLGGLLDASGIVARLAGAVPLADLPAPVRLFSLALVAAALASVMSNTGSAALLIPLAGSVDPSPSAAVIVAVAASFGIPFGISTPPNAMAVAAGLRTQDLLVPGLVILVGGCALVALTGQAVLRTFGVP